MCDERQQTTMSGKPVAPILSVVVIGLNEEGRIGRCLDSIRTATCEVGDVEIVYVDSGSTDRTVDIALTCGVRVYGLSSARAPSPAAGRFVGTQVTQGVYIMFVDGDTEVFPGWVSEAVCVLREDEDVLMVSGSPSRGARGGSANSCVERGLGPLSDVTHISGSWAPVIRRNALEAAGHWNPYLRCVEEADLEIRFKHAFPNGRFVRGAGVTVDTPKATAGSPIEIVRRIRRGFVRGHGQAIRNALRSGYLFRCWRIARPLVLALGFTLGLVLAVLLGYWWQFLLGFALVNVVRAVVTRQYVRLTSVYYSMIIGYCSLWELIFGETRSAKDYPCDWKVIGVHNAGRDECDAVK